MRFTQVLHTRVTSALHARARFSYGPKRTRNSIGASLLNRPREDLNDQFTRIQDPAYNRYYVQRETIDHTFEFDLKFISLLAASQLALFLFYFWLRNYMDKSLLFDRGVTLSQLESEHNNLLIMEPFMCDQALLYDLDLHHDFSPVHGGRYRVNYRA